MSPRSQEQPATGAEPHRARRIAESFGTDPRGYDRARPTYPAALVDRILDGSPGHDVLDVGCGTGIAARQFQAAGCTVLGVEPDARMADFARGRGLPVEVATFEDWQPGGRTFDVIIAAQSWHWVDPDSGAAKAARLLRPGGRLALFGHVFEPPDEIADAFARAYRVAVPGSPFGGSGRRPLDLYRAMYAKFADGVRDTGRYDEPEELQFDWEQRYTRDQWLELLPTTGGMTQLPADKTADILGAVGSAIDAVGGHFTMQYATLATTAVRSAE